MGGTYSQLGVLVTTESKSGHRVRNIYSKRKEIDGVIEGNLGDKRNETTEVVTKYKMKRQSSTGK
jgi:hypothetical protein